MDKLIKQLMIFGAIRALVKSHKKEFLVTERVGATVLGGVTFPVLAPICVYQDMRRIEVAMKGLNKDTYKTHIKKIKDVVL